MMEANAKTGKRTKAPARLTAPVIVLVRPQLGENIGFAARAMANFGLAEPRLTHLETLLEFSNPSNRRFYP